MPAVHLVDRRPAMRPHGMPHTRPHAHRLPRALAPSPAAPVPALPADEDPGDALPWLTVYADEDEAGSADELLMESPPATQPREGGHGLGW